MMNCDKAKQLLSDYLDNALEPGVKKEIDDFLAANAECSKIFADAMSVQKQLQSLTDVTPSEDFEVNLRNRIIQLNNDTTRQPYLNKKGFSLAFSGVAVAAVLYMFVFTDVSKQQNIPGEILPSATTTQTEPSVKANDDQLVLDKENPVAETDSLKNLPEKVDNSGLHLTGDGK